MSRSTQPLIARSITRLARGSPKQQSYGRNSQVFDREIVRLLSRDDTPTASTHMSNKKPTLPGLKVESRASEFMLPTDQPSLPKVLKRKRSRYATRQGFERRVEVVLEQRQENKGTFLQSLTPDPSLASLPQLIEGFDRVLFSPGVHWFKDPRTGVVNFPAKLENLPQVTDFAFERLPPYITSSHDSDLHGLAKREHCRFAGSTSSLSGILSHLYMIISNHREVDLSPLSKAFAREPKTFTQAQYFPGSVVLRFRDGVYSFDSTLSGEKEKNVLLWLGTMLEKWLTIPQAQFNSLLRVNPPELDKPMRGEVYRYSRTRNLAMRAQLDCYDVRLPGSGVFDIKTRAVVAIRQDMLNYQENAGYMIRTLTGRLESFEKEYYDLCRAAFLKYSFQARIGNMDGVFIAHHNTARLLGFQYVPLAEMDDRLFGGKLGGERAFEKCVLALEELMAEIVVAFPDQSLRITYETARLANMMKLWVEPNEWDEVTNGPRPIFGFEVRSRSTINGFPATGRIFYERKNSNWSVQLSIWRTNGSPEVQEIMRNQLKAARIRQSAAAMWLPDGVTPEEMTKRWEEIDFSGLGKKKCSIEDTLDVGASHRRFRNAPFHIRKLRELARKKTHFQPNPTTATPNLSTQLTLERASKKLLKKMRKLPSNLSPQIALGANSNVHDPTKLAGLQPPSVHSSLMSAYKSFTPTNYVSATTADISDMGVGDPMEMLYDEPFQESAHVTPVDITEKLGSAANHTPLQSKQPIKPNVNTASTVDRAAADVEYTLPATATPDHNQAGTLFANDPNPTQLEARHASTGVGKPPIREV